MHHYNLLFALMAFALVASGRADTFTVTSAADSGPGSLRQAIDDANLTAEADTIAFDIPGTGPQRIDLLTLLPKITAPVVIDGSTQPGFSGAPLIELRGTLVTESDAGEIAGVRLQTQDSVVRSLCINGFNGAGIRIGWDASASNNVVAGCYLGTDTTGTNAVPNEHGISVRAASQNIIGGATEGERNVISGNLGGGVLISDNQSGTGNQVVGNYIGTDATGGRALKNGSSGISVSRSLNERIGGLMAGNGNVISGNGIQGIGVGNGTSNLVVLGNKIGTDAAGLSKIANADGGISSDSSTTNIVIGTNVPGGGNVISGNAKFGLAILGGGHKIQGNKIGTDATGTQSIGNVWDGVSLISATGVLLGGAESGAGNLISGNLGNGIKVEGGAKANTIQGNLVGTDLTGRLALPNAGGMWITTSSSSNLVGGDLPGAGNVISGNNGGGIWLDHAGSVANVFQGNFVGVDVTGTNALKNQGSGIGAAKAIGTIIGGTNSGARNVFSGNRDHGVWLAAESKGTVIQGNLIGVDVTGTQAIPNGSRDAWWSAGISLQQSNGNTIGGEELGAGNLISGNGWSGVNLLSQSSGNRIFGNRIGTDLTGSLSVSNGVMGIWVLDGSSSNHIGGTAAGAGNLVSGNGGYGISIEATNSVANVVQGNLTGTDATGTRRLPNRYHGISVSGTGTLVGGSEPGARNIASGNSEAGINIGGGAVRTVVQGNYAGTDITGTKKLPNGWPSVLLGGGATDTLVGGTNAGAGNLISGGNAEGGILLIDATTTNNVIQGNRIGTDIAGTKALGNANVGIFVKSPSNFIGGAEPGAGNVISGNGNHGIHFEGATATNNVVLGNLVGTDATGAVRLGNGGAGVNFVSASNNRIGGVAAGEGNHIRYNTGAGVQVSSGINNAIRGNDCIANGGRPINLGGGGVIANDVLDGDGGANRLQNYPVLREVLGTNGFAVRGSLNSRPSSTFQIDAYSALTGTAPIQVHLGTMTVTTDAAGNVDFELPLSGPITGRYILATATDAAGNTSEMSNAITAQEGAVAVAGRVVGSVTWAGDYTVTGDVVVPAGATLTIAAGSRISAATTDPARAGNYTNRIEIRVTGGTLRALGTSNSPVIFTSAATTPKPGDWGEISLEGGQATFANVVIEFPVIGLRLRNSGVYNFTDITTTRAADRAAWLQTGGTYRFTRGHWTNNAFGFAINAGASCNTTFVDSDFSGNQGHGVYSDGPLHLIDCRVVGNKLFGVSVDRAPVELVRSQLMRNGSHGIYVDQAGASLVATDSRFEDNTGYGVQVRSANLTNCASLRNAGMGVFINNSAGILNMVRCNVSTNRNDGAEGVAGVRLSVVDCDIHRNSGNGLVIFRAPLPGGITGNQITGNAIAVVLKSNLTNDLTLTDCHLSGSTEIRNESARTITATNCSFSSITLGELAKGQTNLSRIYDRADSASVGRVIITNWSATPVNTLVRIVTQPQSVDVAEGGEVSLTVAAESPLPLYYQWRKGGLNLTTETNSNLVVRPAGLGDSGSYTVSVQAGYRSLLSSPATITVVNPSAIAQQPAAQRVAPGSTVTLNVAATGGGLNYQWFRGPTALAGAFGDTLTLTNVTTADSGNYAVVVSNAAGGATSEAALVVVTSEPPGELWVNSFSEGSILRYDTATKAFLGKAVTGIPGGLQNFELGFNGLLYCASAFRNAVYQVNPADGTILGQFISPGGASALNNAIGLAWGPNGRLYVGSWGNSRVLAFDGLSGQFGGTVASAGNPSGFAGGNDLAIGGDGTLYASSYGDGTIKSFTPNRTFLRSTVPAKSNGLTNLTSFTVLADGNFLAANGTDQGSIYHLDAASGLIDRVFIPIGTGGLRAPGGLRVGADGLLYVVDFSSSKVLRFNSVTGEFIDQFVPPVPRGGGESFWLRLMPANSATAPAVVWEPVGIRGDLGSTQFLSVTATGAAPLSYQWRHNGVEVGGATNAGLTLPAVTLADGGTYTVVVANEAGSVESAPALLDLAGLPSLALVDRFADRQVFTAASFVGTTNNLTATGEVVSGEPKHAGKAGAKSLWLTWRAPASGVATFRTVGSSFDTLLAVYTGTALNALTEVAIDEDRGGFLTSEVRFNAEAGTDYQVAVDGFAGAAGTVVLGWELDVVAPVLPVIATEGQPADILARAGQPVSFQVAAGPAGVGYQWSFNGQPLAGANGATLALPAVTPARAGSYRVRITAPSGAFVDSRDALLEVTAADTVGAGALSAEKLADLFADDPVGRGAVQAGLPRRSGFTSVSVGMPGTRFLNLTNSTTEPTDPVPCDVIVAASRWLRFRTPEPLKRFTLVTTNAAFDTVLAVFTNRFAPALVACNDDVLPGLRTSRVVFATEPGVDYLVMVAAKGGDAGNCGLAWSATAGGAVDDPLGMDTAGLVDGHFTFRRVVPPGLYQIGRGGSLETFSPLQQLRVRSGLIEFRDPEPAASQTRFFRYELVSP